MLRIFDQHYADEHLLTLTLWVLWKMQAGEHNSRHMLVIMPRSQMISVASLLLLMKYCHSSVPSGMSTVHETVDLEAGLVKQLQSDSCLPLLVGVILSSNAARAKSVTK